MQCNALRTCLALVFIPCLLPAQTPGPARLTAGFRGGFAIPHLAGTGSPYQGDVQMAWRGELGLLLGPRIALGVEAALNHTTDMAGDCPSRCSPQPDYRAVGARMTWVPTASPARPGLLLSFGAGIYAVHGDYGPEKSTEVGLSAGAEVPLLRLAQQLWMSPSLRVDMLPGISSGGLYVISMTFGLRYWGSR